jgi:hemoglobin
MVVVGETFIWRNLVHNIITFVHLDMKDILNSDDLHLLVEDFYRKLLLDKSISYIFTDVVKIKLEEHLPVLVTFWSQAIFNTGGYYNNLTQIHLDINEKEYLTPELFAIWLKHFNAAVDENFGGTNAEKIKAQALSLATVMQIKINLNGKKLDN